MFMTKEQYVESIKRFVLELEQAGWNRTPGEFTFTKWGMIVYVSAERRIHTPPHKGIAIKPDELIKFGFLANCMRDYEEKHNNGEYYKFEIR